MFGLKNPFPKATETISGILIGKKESSAEPIEGIENSQDKGKKDDAEEDKEQEKEKKTKEAATSAKAAGSRPSSSSKSSGLAETYEQYLVGCVSPLITIVSEADGWTGGQSCRIPGTCN